MRKKSVDFCLFLWFAVICITSLTAQIQRKTIVEKANASLRASLENFREFLSLPNDAYIPEDLDPNIEWLIAEFEALNFETRRLPTKGIDLLFAEKRYAGAEKTVLIYLQIDGQPVDPTKWDQASPYTPQLKNYHNGTWVDVNWEYLDQSMEPELRIFARSASDAKGPVVAFLTALNIVHAGPWQPNFNIKVIMDSEEELGSPNLPAAVDAFRDVLAADMLVILDGPRHISNLPTLTFGARGIATMRLTTYGPRVPQHSGHYGNYAPNPAFRMSQLLASMKDEEGRVIIPGFYDGISLDAATLQTLANVPDNEDVILRDLGIAESDAVAPTYQQALQYPSLNIRGMSSAWVGIKVRTIIPDAAVANLDIRTVKESDPQRLVDLVIDHIRKQGFHICDGEPTEDERRNFPKLLSLHYEISYGAFRTDFNEPISLWLDRALTKVFEAPPIKIRTSGGSIPIAPFVQTLNIPAVTVPIVNRDNNQHSPNENIRIGNYLEGIYTYLGFLTEPID